MIASLRGRIIYKDAGSVIIECAGVGYRVYVTADFLASYAVDDEALMFTYFSVREDGCSLFGFSDMADKELFERVIGVSGIGPKLGMGILSFMGRSGLINAVATSDAKSIAKTPGIGAKTAQKLIIELQDKIAKDVFESLGAGVPAGSGSAMSQSMNDAVAALTALGYSQTEALSAVRSVERAAELDTDELLSLALKRI